MYLYTANFRKNWIEIYAWTWKAFEDLDSININTIYKTTSICNYIFNWLALFGTYIILQKNFGNFSVPFDIKIISRISHFLQQSPSSSLISIDGHFRKVRWIWFRSGRKHFHKSLKSRIKVVHSCSVFEYLSRNS